MNITDRTLTLATFALLGTLVEKMTGQKATVRLTDEDGNFLDICPGMTAMVSLSSAITPGEASQQNADFQESPHTHSSSPP